MVPRQFIPAKEKRRKYSGVRGFILFICSFLIAVHLAFFFDLWTLFSKMF